MDTDIANLTRFLPHAIHWNNIRWERYNKMPDVWNGKAELLPIELIFGNYLLRSPHSMLWIHLTDEKRGEPFDIWEIRVEKLQHTTPNYDEDDEEEIGEDEWENVIVEYQADVKTTVDFIKRCIFEDKMAIYLKPRLAWDSKVAERWEETHKDDDEEES